MIKPGDYIGGIFINNNGYYLLKDKVTKIVSTKKATKVYSKKFYPFDLEDLEENTKEMEEAHDYILTKEEFKLTEPIEHHCNIWIDWANKHPDQVEGLI